MNETFTADETIKRLTRLKQVFLASDNLDAADTIDQALILIWMQVDVETIDLDESVEFDTNAIG